MFSMRLFFAVAGVLLILNTNQVKAAVRQSRTTKYNQNQLLLAAWLENFNATSLLDELIPQYPQLSSTKKALSQARDYLYELLQKKATNRRETFTKTMDSELKGYFGSTNCTYGSECYQTFKYVQLATGHIIGAVLKENTIDGATKNHVRDIISGNITEEGAIERGATVLQTYEVAVKVWSCLRGFCKPN